MLSNCKCDALICAVSVLVERKEVEREERERGGEGEGREKRERERKLCMCAQSLFNVHRPQYQSPYSTVYHSPFVRVNNCGS